MLIMLSSTINTLMGGTDVSNNAAKLGGKVGPFVSGAVCFCRVLLLLAPGLGLATLGVGGPEVLPALAGTVMLRSCSGTGGVGRAAAAGCRAIIGCFSVDAVESRRGRFARLETEDVSVVGEEVCCLGWFGRLCLLKCARLLLPPGDGRAGTCPVFNTDMARSWVLWDCRLSWERESCEVLVRRGEGWPRRLTGGICGK